MAFDFAPLHVDLETALWILLDAMLMLLAVVGVVRLTGLRAFAKMSAFDFTVTVAVGSVMASIILNPDTSAVHGLLVIAALMIAQVVIALARRLSPRAGAIVDNTPLLLMEGETILEENLAASRMTRKDLLAKLREANVTDFSTVRAVVMETTGEVSVLHGSPDATSLPRLLEGVRR